MVLSFLQTLQMASESVASVGENNNKGPEKWSGSVEVAIECSKWVAGFETQTYLNAPPAA